jgi:hypothetical protein
MTSGSLSVAFSGALSFAVMETYNSTGASQLRILIRACAGEQQRTMAPANFENKLAWKYVGGVFVLFWLFFFAIKVLDFDLNPSRRVCKFLLAVCKSAGTSPAFLSRCVAWTTVPLPSAISGFRMIWYTPYACVGLVPLGSWRYFLRIYGDILDREAVQLHKYKSKSILRTLEGASGIYGTQHVNSSPCDIQLITEFSDYI